jgi:hypothetical protein
VKNVDPLATQQFIEKADHFFQAMKLVKDDPDAYRTSVALLAVHSAISLKDAVVIGLTGKKSRHQDHSAAVHGLEGLSRKFRISNKNGIGHLRWLLAGKTKIAYSRERLDDAMLHMSIDRAERFHSWAYNHFKEILHDPRGT